MKKNKIALILLTLLFVSQAGLCESLFMMGANQTYYAEPKSLYSSVRARTVGDLITIVMEENISLIDNLKYDSARSSNTVDNFTTMINTILPGEPLNKKFNNFGGSNTVAGSTANTRNMTFNDYVTVQVVQTLPNGNLMIQGKKTIMNANEKTDLLISGIVDPRWINDMGQVSSRNIANLQFAVNGKGSTSRSGNEGIINRAVRYLF
jgi:flagellar L-ring protein precursor FlgH